VPLIEVEGGPTAGNELRAAGRKAIWIVRLGDRDADLPLLDAWVAAFGELSVQSGVDGELIVEDPQYGTVRFLADAKVVAEGRILDPADWTVRGEATRMQRRE
jgi:hypothetical protein